MILRRPGEPWGLRGCLCAVLAAVLGAGLTTPDVARSQGVSSTRLSVQLTLRRAATAPSQAYVTDATLFIYAANTSLVRYSATVRTDSSGAFTEDVTGLSSGTYDVVIKPYGALGRKRSGVTLQPDGTVTLTFGPFTEGDADSAAGNNAVNQTDANAVKSQFGTTCSTGATIAQCPDFNRDGKVTLLDLSTVMRSYGKTGPEAQS